MADRKRLGIIGYLMGGVTAVVVLVGVFVIHGHLTGRYVLDQPVSTVSVL